MTAFLEALDGVRFRVFLARKYEGDVAPLVLDGHSVRKGILARCPSQVDPCLLVNPGSSHVKRLVTEDLKHPQQRRLGPFAGLTGYQSKIPGIGKLADQRDARGAHLSC